MSLFNFKCMFKHKRFKFKLFLSMQTIRVNNSKPWLTNCFVFGKCSCWTTVTMASTGKYGINKYKQHLNLLSFPIILSSQSPLRHHYRAQWSKNRCANHKDQVNLGDGAFNCLRVQLFILSLKSFPFELVERGHYHFVHHTAGLQVSVASRANTKQA